MKLYYIYIQVCSDEYEKYIKNSIITYGKNNPNIRGFEIPKAIIIETESFTLENGLLTPALKINRTKINNKYNYFILDLNKI